MSSTVGEFFGGSTRKIRDEVWGDIPVDKAVRTLLETAAMSRLKGMNPLGFALYAFPAAKHTRFDHAIGVYYLTRLTLKRIIDSGAYLEDQGRSGFSGRGPAPRRRTLPLRYGRRVYKAARHAPARRGRPGA